jgi:hypothetical protein
MAQQFNLQSFHGNLFADTKPAKAFAAAINARIDRFATEALSARPSAALASFGAHA